MEQVAIMGLAIVVAIAFALLGKERKARKQAEADAERWAKELRESEARQDRMKQAIRR